MTITEADFLPTLVPTYVLNLLPEMMIQNGSLTYIVDRVDKYGINYIIRTTDGEQIVRAGYNTVMVFDN